MDVLNFTNGVVAGSRFFGEYRHINVQAGVSISTWKLNRRPENVRSCTAPFGPYQTK